MANKLLCKVLCHNLCCLIQSQYELGIDAAFWASDENETARQSCESDETLEALAWV